LHRRVRTSIMGSMRWLRLAPALLALLFGGAPCAAEDAKRIPADLQPAVDAAVARAGAWLTKQAADDGTFRWSVPLSREWSCWDATSCDQGLTALAALALVRAGVPRSDSGVTKAIALLRSALSSDLPAVGGRDARTFTYAAGSLLWMLSELRPAGFDAAAAQAALALSHGTTPDGLWGYALPRVRVHDGYADVLPDAPSPAPPDVSNAQFAVLGLLAADRLGVWLGDVAWAKSRDGLRAMSLMDGSFGYRHDAGAPEFFKRGRRLTTAIAAANLFVALRRLGVSRDEALADRTVARALAWLEKHPFLDRATSRWAGRDVGDMSDRLPYYEMIAIERLGAFTAQDRVGGAEWYRVGATTLLAMQKPDGSWPGGTAEASFMNAVQNTVLSILFLSRALDAVPVTSPDFNPGDLLGGKDAPEPLFGELVTKGARAHAAALGDARLAWQRAFVALGERGLGALIVRHSDGPPLFASAIHNLLAALTGAKIDSLERESRSLAWTKWLFEHRGRLAPSSDGTSFIDAK
jgi:hypothetical protein